MKQWLEYIGDVHFDAYAQMMDSTKKSCMGLSKLGIIVDRRKTATDQAERSISNSLNAIGEAIQKACRFMPSAKRQFDSAPCDAGDEGARQKNSGVSGFPNCIATSRSENP